MENYNKNSLYRLLAVSITFLTFWLFFFWETFVITENTWNTSDTYGHGYLIPILSLYYIWLNKAKLVDCEYKPYLLAGFPLLGLCVLWLIGSVSYTNVVQQFAVFLMPFFACLMIFGKQVCRVTSFPLLFLIFCVPFGEGLIPTLQIITAEITIFFIKLIGIPVYVDGLFITLTSGVFEVAKACSGISYLISSLAVGSFYAFITYSSIKKRIYFILFALFVPILANGLRALIIVLLAHYSDMAIATGFDHIIYGWVFFGFIIFIMFSVGGRWADSNVFPSNKNETKFISLKSFNVIAMPLLASFLFFAITKLYVTHIKEVEPVDLKSKEIISFDNKLSKVSYVDGKALSDFSRADILQHTSIEGLSFKASFYGAYFAKETSEREFISYQNIVYDINDWTLDSTELLTIDNQNFNRYVVVNSNGQRKQIIFAYIVDGIIYTSPLKVKLAMLKNKLINADSSALYVSFTSDAVASNTENKLALMKLIENHIEQLK